MTVGAAVAEARELAHVPPEPELGTGGNYLIWSIEHQAWWGERCIGYHDDWREAGRYTREEAINVCRVSLPVGRRHDGFKRGRKPQFNEVPVRLDDILEFADSGVVS
jgi:hypothetical protein